MNIFKNPADIYGEYDPERTKGIMKEFWSLAGEIKKELGERDALLFEYLREVFETLHASMSLDAASEADHEFGRVISLCSEVLNGDMKSKDFEGMEPERSAAKYIEEHPLVFDGVCDTDIYAQLIAPDFIKSACVNYARKIKHRLKMDATKINLNETYIQISEIVGEEKLEQLNSFIKRQTNDCKCDERVCKGVYGQCNILFCR